MHWASPRALILNIQAATDRFCLESCRWSKSKSIYIISLQKLLLYYKLHHLQGFQLYHPAAILTIHIICLYLLGKYRVFVVEKSTMVAFSIFHFTQKQQKTSFHALTRYTMLCAKTLILAGVYVEFFLVYIILYY